MLTLLLFSIIANCVSGGVTCSEAIDEGNLRIFKTRKCIDYEGRDVRVWSCNGNQPQNKHIFCIDGTIRNGFTNFCLTPESNDGTGFLKYAPCKFLPEIPDYQKWVVGKSISFTDNGGIAQTAKEYINVESGNCMDVYRTGDMPDGMPMKANPCTGELDQYFYFRDRGQAIKSGRLRNQLSGKCMQIEGYPCTYCYLGTHTCSDDEGQFWKYYANGELINHRTNCPMDAEGDGSSVGSRLRTYISEETKDQMWDTPEVYSDGDFLGWRNEMAGLCIDVSGGKGFGNMVLNTCEGTTDQRFEWVTEDWKPPNSKWTQVGCNEEGSVKHEISNSVEYSSEVTTEIAFSIETTIEESLLFESGSVSTSVSSSVASTWGSSHGETTTTSFSCDNYPNGETWKGGCMWQLYMETRDVSDRSLAWHAKIIRCTRGMTTPSCPPFTQCEDEECSKCVDGVTYNGGNTHSEL